MGGWEKEVESKRRERKRCKVEEKEKGKKIGRIDNSQDRKISWRKEERSVQVQEDKRE